MLATKQQSYVAIPKQGLQRQPVRRSAPQSERTFSLWDRVSIVGCIVACAMVFWVLAAANAHITEVNRSIDHLNVQAQKLAAQNASISQQINTLSAPQNVLKVVKKNGDTFRNTMMIPAGQNN